MQQGGGAQGLHFVLGSAQLFGDFDSISLYALQVPVDGFVLGLDGHSQGFDGAQV